MRRPHRWMDTRRVADLGVLVGVITLVCSGFPARRATAAAPRDDAVTALRARIDKDDVAWLREATVEQLRGCRVQGRGGVWLHTPDGVGNYRALWTRDFAYMVEYAGDLLDPSEVAAEIRYLLSGQRDVPYGRYQNGAFWGTPVAWVAPTIARRDLDLAVRMVRDVIADYRARGIMECVNGDYHNVPQYVASATNVYGLVRP